MRVLFYVLGFIAFCLFSFYLIGVFVPKTEYENTIVVNRSIDKCWKVFSDDTLVYDWMPGLQKIEYLKGKEMQAGSEFKMHLVEAGQKYVITETVNEVKKNELYSFTLNNEVLTNNIQFQFKETAAFTTEIKSINSVEAKNWFLSSLFFFLESDFKEQDLKTLNNFKNLVESDIVTK
jgi:hypothetical protein